MKAQSIGIFPNDACEYALEFWLESYSQTIDYDGQTETVPFTLPEQKLDGFSHCGHIATYETSFKIL